MTWSLKRKILVPTIVLIVVTMSISIARTYMLATDALSRNAFAQLNSMTHATVDLVDIWAEDLKTLVIAITERPEFAALLRNDTEATRDQCCRILKSLQEIAPQFAYFHLYNAAGEARASSLVDSIGKVKVPDRAYFLEAMKGNVHFSEVYLSRTTGKPSCAVAAPIRYEGKVIGVLAGIPNIAKFCEELVDGAKVFDTGMISLFDVNGVVVAHKDRALILKQDLRQLDHGKKLLERKSGDIRYVLNGREITAMLAPCRAVSWTVLAEAPTSEVLADANRLAKNNLFLFVVGLVAIVVLLLAITHSVVGPILRITDGLDQGADHVAQASAEVASSSQTLASGATQQAASLEQTSAALTSLADHTRKNANNADQ
ncbi:MAG TPA: cache domain-containing protein, partial [Candidatus Ozemobacteraceae bacterium]|nr:cache domain-containing protein [Candidatus Ozemobacteraceae bacterium]